MVQLSIIIPHYNSTKLLSTLLETIPNNSAIQVIVIDDNSNEFCQNKLNKLILKENVELYSNYSGVKGAGVCRNIGIKKAIGNWILFADSDDFFIDDFYSIVKQYFNSSNDVIYFVPTSINLKDGTEAKRHLTYKTRINNYINNPTIETELNLRYRFSPPWSKLIKRKLITENQIKFDEVIASNDIMFSTKVGYNLKEFDVSLKEIYCVTRSEGTLTRTINKQIFDSRLNVFVNYNRYLKKRISRSEYKLLNINGAKYLKMSLNFNLLKCVHVLYVLKKNNIRIIDKSYIKPFKFIKTIKTIKTLIKSKLKKRNIY